jgi:hypothetical protein
LPEKLLRILFIAIDLFSAISAALCDLCVKCLPRFESTQSSHLFRCLLARPYFFRRVRRTRKPCPIPKDRAFNVRQSHLCGWRIENSSYGGRAAALLQPKLVSNLSVRASRSAPLAGRRPRPHTGQRRGAWECRLYICHQQRPAMFYGKAAFQYFLQKVSN